MSSKSIMKMADEAILSSPHGAVRDYPYSKRWYNSYTAKHMIIRTQVAEEPNRSISSRGSSAEKGDIILEIGARKTFDRWANSRDIMKIIHTHIYNANRRKRLSVEAITYEIHKALTDADFLCRRIPSRMFNRFITIDI